MAGVSTEGAAVFNNKKVVYLLVDNAMKWLGVTAQESTIVPYLSVWIIYVCVVCAARCARKANTHDRHTQRTSLQRPSAHKNQ